MLPVRMFLINEEEDVERKFAHRINKRVMRDVSDPFNIPDRRFIELFRLNKDLVAYLFQSLVAHLEEGQRSTRIAKEVRILVALRFFATGNYQRGIGEEFIFSTSQQVVSRCIEEVAQAVNDNLGEQWIKFPTTQERKREIKTGFMQKAGFPGIIGCIDCTHVAILAPSQQEHNYLNRKGFHSKNVQIVCSSNLEIVNINARYSGATNDAFIWRASGIKALLERNYNRGERNEWLGDSGYPLQPWLITPFQGEPERNTPEGRFNYAHKVTRSTVEWCNAYLKLRFRCLMGERKLRYSPEKVGLLINSCAILHNMCIRAGMALEGVEEEEFEGVPIDNDMLPNPVLIEGNRARQDIVNRYFL